jgi:hypothetical protein
MVTRKPTEVVIIIIIIITIFLQPRYNNLVSGCLNIVDIQEITLHWIEIEIVNEASTLI